MLIIVQFLIISIIGVVSQFITKNIFVGIIVSFILSLLLKRIQFTKASSLSMETDFVPFNTIYDFLFEVLEDVEQGKTSPDVLFEIVTNMNLIDEQGVKWKVDPSTLEISSSKEKIQPYDPARPFKVTFT